MTPEVQAKIEQEFLSRLSAEQLKSYHDGTLNYDFGEDENGEIYIQSFYPDGRWDQIWQFTEHGDLEYHEKTTWPRPNGRPNTLVTRFQLVFEDWNAVYEKNYHLKVI